MFTLPVLISEGFNCAVGLACNPAHWYGGSAHRSWVAMDLLPSIDCVLSFHAPLTRAFLHVTRSTTHVCAHYFHPACYAAPTAFVHAHACTVALRTVRVTRRTHSSPTDCCRCYTFFLYIASGAFTAFAVATTPRHWSSFCSRYRFVIFWIPHRATCSC